MSAILTIGIACTAGYAAFLVALAFGFRREARVSHWLAEGEDGPDPAPRVTVLIPARNEELEIGDCLQAVLSTDWPDMEIVVIDDDSQDGTADVVRERAHADAAQRIRLVQLGAGGQKRGHKKHAITAGMEIASGSIILQTDADCRPGPRWIRSMVSHFTSETGFVAGPVTYEAGDGFLAGFQALELMGLVGIAAGSIGLGWPITCNGANVAYRKQVFLDAGGHEGQEHLSSGDDELFMLKVDRLTPWTVRFNTRPDAVVRTAPETTLAEFLVQRRRWASKGLHYPDRTLVALRIMIFLAFVLVVGLLPASIADPSLLPTLGIALALKMAGEIALLSTSTTHFGRARLLRWFLPGQPFQVLYVIVAAVGGVMGGFEWKGRRLAR